MTKIDRRSFLLATSGSVVGGLVSACGVFDETEVDSYNAYQAVVRVRAIRIQTIGNPILTAQEIAAGVPVTKYIREGNHSHPFVISTAQLRQIAAAQQGQGLSTPISFNSLPPQGQRQGHTHPVTINPTNYVNPNSPGVTIPPSGGTTVPGGLPGQSPMYAALGEGDSPTLYVQGAEQLTDASVAYCLGPKATCDGSTTLWRTMVRSSRFSGRQVFESSGALTFQPSPQGCVGQTQPCQQLNIRGRTSANRLVQILLRVTQRR